MSQPDGNGGAHDGSGHGAPVELVSGWPQQA